MGRRSSDQIDHVGTSSEWMLLRAQTLQPLSEVWRIIRGTEGQASADYVVSPEVLIGALVQVDSTDEDIDDPTLKGNIDGTGWMAGPYIGFRLADNLYFDARAAWGQSDNDMDLTDRVLGQRTGSFETDLWLASATLTGNEYYGAWRFTLQVSIAYGEEDYSSYSTSLQQLVPGDSAQIGRVTGNMEVGYRFNGYNGSIIEPHVAVSGIWNFVSDDLYIDGTLADTDENRAPRGGRIAHHDAERRGTAWGGALRWHRRQRLRGGEWVALAQHSLKLKDHRVPVGQPAGGKGADRSDRGPSI